MYYVMANAFTKCEVNISKDDREKSWNENLIWQKDNISCKNRPSLDRQVLYLYVKRVSILICKSFTFKYLQWDPHKHSALKRQSSNWEAVGSNPAVGKNISFCNSRFLRVANTSNQPIEIKSTVTYT